jgi:hypothetical protein
MNRSFIYTIVLVILSLSFSSSCKKDDSGDGTVPVILVLGSNPTNWALELPYIDAGAIAYDITIEGDTIDITNKIATTNKVNVSSVGDYEVKYNVTDESGVEEKKKIRVVKVVVGKKN